MQASARTVAQSARIGLKWPTVARETAAARCRRSLVPKSWWGRPCFLRPLAIGWHSLYKPVSLDKPVSAWCRTNKGGFPSSPHPSVVYIYIYTQCTLLHTLPPSLLSPVEEHSLTFALCVAQTHFLQHLFPKEREKKKKCDMLMKNKINNIINCPAP